MKFFPLSEDCVQLKLFQLRSEHAEKFQYSTESQELIYANLTAGTEGKVIAAALILGDGLPKHRPLAQKVIRDFCANAEECDGLSLLLAMETLQLYSPEVLKRPEYQRIITMFLESGEETSEGRMALHLQAKMEGRQGSAQDMAEVQRQLPWWTRLFNAMSGVIRERRK